MLPVMNQPYRAFDEYWVAVHIPGDKDTYVFGPYSGEYSATERERFLHIYPLNARITEPFLAESYEAARHTAKKLIPVELPPD